MRTALRYTLLVLLPAFSTQLVHSQAVPDPDPEKLHDYFTALEQNNRFMGSVFLMQNGEVLFERAYGKASEGRSAGPDTRYRTGSITKTFTAAMLFKLIEQDKLSLDTTLDRFFPAISNSESITIEHLLKHQSGLVNFTNLEEYIEYHTEPRNQQQHLEHFSDLDTSFEPGSDTEYSNTAYVLLGFIIEDLTGLSYAEALQKLIAEPLDLRATYFGSQIDTTAQEAQSFSYMNSEWNLSSETDMSVPHGAGAIVSTAEETAAFYSALFNGEVISENSFEEITRFNGQLGPGLLRIPFYDRMLLGHNGGIDGFQSSAAHDPESNLTYALLGNGINFNFNDILVGMLSIIYGRDFEIPDFEERQTITLSREDMLKYIGEYSSSDLPLQIRIFEQGSNLMAQATGQGAFPLSVYDEHTMGFEQAGLEIVFDEKSDGRYRSFTLLQAGMSYHFTLEE